MEPSHLRKNWFLSDIKVGQLLPLEGNCQGFQDQGYFLLLLLVLVAQACCMSTINILIIVEQM